MRPAHVAPADPAARHRVILWDAAARRFVRELPLPDGCYGMAFSADGSTLATATFGQGSEVAVWRVADGTRLSGFAAASITPRIS